MIGDNEEGWFCRQCLVSVFISFLLSVNLMRSYDGSLHGCNLVLVLLCFTWGMGSILIISEYWNKGLLLVY